MDTIVITIEEYIKLRIAAEELRRLECGGVDNWEWYGDALNPENESSIKEFEEQLKERLKG